VNTAIINYHNKVYVYIHIPLCTFDLCAVIRPLPILAIPEYLYLINYPVFPTPFNYDRPAKIAVSSSQPWQIYRSPFLLRTMARIGRQTSTGTNMITRGHDFHRACNVRVCAGIYKRVSSRMFIRSIVSLVRRVSSRRNLSTRACLDFLRIDHRLVARAAWIFISSLEPLFLFAIKQRSN